MGEDFAGVLTVNSKAFDPDKANKMADRWSQIAKHAFTTKDGSLTRTDGNST